MRCNSGNFSQISMKKNQIQNTWARSLEDCSNLQHIVATPDNSVVVQLKQFDNSRSWKHVTKMENVRRRRWSLIFIVCAMYSSYKHTSRTSSRPAMPFASSQWSSKWVNELNCHVHLIRVFVATNVVLIPFLLTADVNRNISIEMNLDRVIVSIE